MRRKIYILLVCCLFVGCEIIDEADRLIPVETMSEGERTHVLLEFTGFRCVNCPSAVETAQSLQSLYGERLIVVALHPASNPFTQGKYDYTCPAADSIYQYMGGSSSTPFPTGNIDMKQVDGRCFFAPPEWPAQLTKAIEEESKEEQAIFRTSYWLVEDSVLGVQAMPDGTIDMNYYHRHVLRAVSEEPNITIPDGCNTAHCTIVKLILDTKDNHILNAYETKLDAIDSMSSMDD